VFSGVFGFNGNTSSLQPSERRVARHKFSESSVAPTCSCSCDTPVLRRAALCNIRPALSCSNCLSLLSPSPVSVSSAVTSTDQEQCWIIFSSFFLCRLLVAIFFLCLSWLAFWPDSSWRLHKHCTACCVLECSVYRAMALASFGPWVPLFLFVLLKREDLLVAILGSYFGFVVNLLVCNFFSVTWWL